MNYSAVSKNKRYLYVVFSSTRCGIGKFIRVVTRYEYNHTSISLDPDLKKMYSFARYRKHAPLYAGFVEESCRRFYQDGKLAMIKVYRIPITEEKYNEIDKCIKDMKDNRDRYIYNMVSAMSVPLHRKVKADGAFTCVEFAVYMLANYCDGLPVTDNRFWSIKALQESLSDYLFYEGPYTEAVVCADWGDDGFLTDSSVLADAIDTLRTNSRLLVRLCRRLLKA